MKLTVTIKAINGYISPKKMERAVNDSLNVFIDTKLKGEILLEWNGQVFRAQDRTATIPPEAILAENSIIVRVGEKRFNCGKLFCEPIDAEMAAMLDIETKYQKDMLTWQQWANEQLQSVLLAIKDMQQKQKEIVAKYNAILGGVDYFAEE
jgi:hypothetical protein